jgi:NADH:ubiquinone oxidoreductase subunit 6 (subunit J)
MNAVAFAPLAVLIVIGSLATVVLPRLRDAGAALLVTLVLIAVFSAVSGQYLVAVAELLAAAGGLAAARTVVPLSAGRRARGAGAASRVPRLPRSWWIGAAVAIPLAVLFAVVLGMSSGALTEGGGAPSPASVIGSHAPYALVIAIVLAVTGFGAGALLGRTGADEREADARHEARRTRDERMRARREAREAARRARREASPTGGSS